MLEINILDDKNDSIGEVQLIPEQYKYSFQIHNTNYGKFFTEDCKIFVEYKHYVLIVIHGQNIPLNVLSWQHNKYLKVKLDCPVYSGTDFKEEFDDNIIIYDDGFYEIYKYNNVAQKVEDKKYRKQYYQFNKMSTVYFKFISDSNYKWEWQLIQEINTNRLEKER